MLSESRINELLKSIAENKCDPTQHLYEKKFDDSFAEKLAVSLLKNTTITYLSLNDNNITDIGIVPLCQALKGHQSIKELHLDGNELGDAGADSLQDLLRQNKTLETLSLNHVKCSDESAKKLAATLFSQASIQKLHLVSNNITDKSMPLFCTALKQNTSLRELVLSGNNLGLQSAICIADMLKVNETLQTISLYRTGCTDAGAILIADALKANTGLLCMDLGMNSFTQPTVQSIRTMVKDNICLIRVSLETSTDYHQNDWRLSARNLHVSFLINVIKSLFPDALLLENQKCKLALQWIMDQNIFNLKMNNSSFNKDDYSDIVSKYNKIISLAETEASQINNRNNNPTNNSGTTEKKGTIANSDNNDSKDKHDNDHNDVNNDTGKFDSDKFDDETYQLMLKHISDLEESNNSYYSTVITLQLKLYLTIAKTSWTDPKEDPQIDKHSGLPFNISVLWNNISCCIDKNFSKDIIELGLGAFAQLMYNEGMKKTIARNMRDAESHFLDAFVCGVHGPYSNENEFFISQAIGHYSGIAINPISNYDGKEGYEAMLTQLAKENYHKFCILHARYFQRVHELNLKPNTTLTKTLENLALTFYPKDPKAHTVGTADTKTNAEKADAKTTAEKADAKTTAEKRDTKSSKDSSKDRDIIVLPDDKTVFVISDSALSLDDDENSNREKDKSAKP